MNLASLIKNSFYSVFSKFIIAIVQIVSVPMIINRFGKDSYGLVVIALSLNTLYTILQLGLPTGIVKFISEWLSSKSFEKINKTIKSLTFIYIIVGILNFFFLLVIILFYIDIFKVDITQVKILKQMILISAIISLVSIPLSSLDQYLIASKNLFFLSNIEIVKSALQLFNLFLFLYVFKEGSIVAFFLLKSLLMIAFIPLKLYKWNQISSISDFVPKIDKKSLKHILNYSLQLMIFSFFVALSDKLRPIILAAKVMDSSSLVLADYSIVNNIRIFLLMISGSVTAALLPRISKTGISDNDILSTISKVTFILWSLSCSLVTSMILTSKELLVIYVGSATSVQIDVLNLVLIATMYNLYITPITTVFLSSSNLKPLILSSIFGAIVSTSLMVKITPIVGLYSYPISLLVYNSLHFAISHTIGLGAYNLKRINHVFTIFIPPVIINMLTYLLFRNITYSKNIFINISLTLVFSMLTSIISIFIFYFIYKRVKKNG